MKPTSNTPTVLITGATSGLGLELARQILVQSHAQMILPVRNDERRQQLHAMLGPVAQGRMTTPLLDLASLSSVKAAAASICNGLQRPLDAVMFNAGVQSAERSIVTGDGLEQTFAVNHLAHHVLLRAIEPHLADSATVGWVGSGTHLPDGATRFGYTGAHYCEPGRLAQGNYDSTGSQASRDAYSTSKGLNILSARHWARLSAPAHSDRRFFAFDPGLMPGTGLAREGSALQRLGWKYVLPLAARFMKGTSTTQRSAALLADLFLGKRPFGSGDYVEFTGHKLEAFMPPNERAYAEALFAFSDKLG